MSGVVGGLGAMLDAARCSIYAAFDPACCRLCAAFNSLRGRFCSAFNGLLHFGDNPGLSRSRGFRRFIGRYFDAAQKNEYCDEQCYFVTNWVHVGDAFNACS
ncbi:MAG: hypothetical protein ACYDC8_05185 [Gammaproteobacteria bacterium]